jgi:hypothetical protein
MEQANSNKRLLGHVMFGTVALCAVLLFLLWNPLVLRPRFWNAAVILRSLSIDTGLLVIGVGLIRLRRWAALLASVLAAYVAVNFAAATEGGLGAPLTLSLLAPLPLTLRLHQLRILLRALFLFVFQVLSSDRWSLTHLGQRHRYFTSSECLVWPQLSQMYLPSTSRFRMLE